VANNYEGVALVSPVTLPYVKRTEHGAAWFIGKVLAQMLAASGLAKAEVDGLAISSMSLQPDTVVSLTDHFELSPRWIEQLATGGASGVMTMQRAARAVQAGDAEVVACIAGDTIQPTTFRDLVANFSRFSKDTAYPYGGAGPNGTFALMTDYYMRYYGVTREDFGRVCIAQRYNAQHFPYALLRKPMSMDDYLNARPIADPLALLDCVMPCAGGEGFLVMSTERAKSMGLPYGVILAAAERHNAYFDDDIQIRGGWASYRDELYDQAGLAPSDIDFIQTYDDYPVIVLQQFEDLGFCGKGEVAAFVRDTPLTFDGGGLANNTSGGQLSAGQAGFAGGFLGIVEGIRQLVGPDLGNHVPGAKVGMVSGYGMVMYDHCLCTCATIIAGGGHE
jgi:acetyl-CoA acetyltransferase